MTDVHQFAQDDPAIEVLHGGGISGGACVVLWVQRAKRAPSNLAANVAVELAKANDPPVVAVFCLVPGFPAATHRAYHFMAEGLAELRVRSLVATSAGGLKSANQAT
jgi:hypothetical protein